MRLFSRLLPALLLTLSTSFAFAITNTFTGTGNWSDASKWTSGVPFALFGGDVLVINGNCTYDGGGEFVISGELKISSTGVLNVVGPTIRNEGGTITIDGTLNNLKSVDNRGFVNVSGTLSNSAFWENLGPLTILNGGRFTNNASGNLYSGFITVNTGATFTNNGIIQPSVQVNGSIFNNANIGPTPGQKHSVTGNYTASSSAIHTWRIGGTAANTYDFLEVGGTAALNGALNVSLVNGYTPTNSDNIAIVTGIISGTFSSVNIPSEYVLVYNSNSVVLRHASILQTKGNTVIGAEALISNTTGIENAAFGYRALRLNTQGYDNTALGSHTLHVNTTGNHNTATGWFALFGNTIGNYNTAVGSTTLTSNKSGIRNTAIGSTSLSQNTTGNYNTALGSYALNSNTTASGNTASGYTALEMNTTGSSNTASGFAALNRNTFGNYNTASGNEALRYNVTGGGNTATGSTALYSNTLGNSNTSMGHGSLYSNNTGNNNTAVGAQALYRNTTGENNLANGAYALFNNTTGNYNTAFGYGALNNNITGSGNITSGAGALASNSAGSYNMVFGANALGSNVSGDNNIAIGVNAAYATRSVNSTFIGPNTYGAVDISNSTAIGHGAAVLASNQVRIGDVGVSSIGGQVGWTTLSDGRFKANIKEDVPGLAFINKLRPVTYTLDITALDVKMKGKNYKGQITTGSDKFKVTTIIKESPEEKTAKEKRAKIKYTGFVAQEVEEAAKKLDYDFSGVDVPKSDEDVYGIRYSDFVVPLVKSVQEQQAQIEELKTEVEQLKEMVNALLASKGTTSNNSNIRVSSAYLVANAPNPFNSSTIIRYHIPDNASSAKLVITNMKGQVMKTTMLNGRGYGQVTLNAGTLAAGSYNYSLWLGNEQVDTKQMLIAR